MPTTVPNQKVIQIHREPLGGNFLGINNDNWKYAARVLGAQAFLLYTYLASNKNEYKTALSPAAVQKDIGMPRSTFYDQLRKLESMGFLVHDKGNLCHFYEVPQSATHTQTACVPDNEKSTIAENPLPPPVQESPQKDIEIYINTKNKTNIPEEKMNLRTQNHGTRGDTKGFHF